MQWKQIIWSRLATSTNAHWSVKVGNSLYFFPHMLKGGHTKPVSSVFTFQSQEFVGVRQHESHLAILSCVFTKTRWVRQWVQKCHLTQGRVDTIKNTSKGKTSSSSTLAKVRSQFMNRPPLLVVVDNIPDLLIIQGFLAVAQKNLCHLFGGNKS